MRVRVNSESEYESEYESESESESNVCSRVCSDNESEESPEKTISEIVDGYYKNGSIDNPQGGRFRGGGACCVQ